MPLPLPNLDDRTFDQLVQESLLRLERAGAGWTAQSPSDPGRVLLELFCHLTETMIYRLNRVPEKAYVAFLRLLGVNLQPPAAARVVLRFSRAAPADRSAEVPRGTRVAPRRASGDEEAPVFVTAHAATIAAGETTTDVLAYHCEQVDAELAGVGTGLAGLSVRAQRPPLVTPTGDDLDLVVAVEVAPGELDEQAPVLEHGGKTYRLWREVGSFSNLGAERHVYVADRMEGLVTFAPAARLTQPDGSLAEAPQALGAIPPAGREIRLWYRRGGGPAGNVEAGSLTVLKDPLPGLGVTNPEPASGGRAAEALANALVRGPQELHSLQRAVTARDFELVAQSTTRAVARAKAVTQAALWRHAAPGTVEVLLVPDVPPAERAGGRITAETLQTYQADAVRAQIQQELEMRRPLGTTCLASWARYKTVRVEARLVVRREENLAQVRARVAERLHQTISPLPTAQGGPGWPFGRALRASNVFDIALKEPGVLWMDRVRFVVDDVPGADVRAVAADAFQPSTWYAGSGPGLFRTLNDGDSWERLAHFPGERVGRLAPHPERAGLLAVVTDVAETGGSRVRFSGDCGESWLGEGGGVREFAFGVNDVAWTTREGEPVLFLATDKGLYELMPGGSPVQVLVKAQDQDLGFYAVATARGARGLVSVAVAGQGTTGVFLSVQGGRSKTFDAVGLDGKDIRTLAVQHDGPRAYLWAGAAAYEGEEGEGCFRWELREGEHPPEGWQAAGEGWQGGSCFSLAFAGIHVLAATHRAGVLHLDATGRSLRWQAPDVRCGLPLRSDTGRFLPVEAVAASAGVSGAGYVLAGTAEGLSRGAVADIAAAESGQVYYQSQSSNTFTEKVALPPNWLFCSGEHELSVVSQDEAERD